MNKQYDEQELGSLLQGYVRGDAPPPHPLRQADCPPFSDLVERGSPEQRRHAASCPDCGRMLAIAEEVRAAEARAQAQARQAFLNALRDGGRHAWEALVDFARDPVAVISPAHRFLQAAGGGADTAPRKVDFGPLPDVVLEGGRTLVRVIDRHTLQIARTDAADPPEELVRFCILSDPAREGGDCQRFVVLRQWASERQANCPLPEGVDLAQKNRVTAPAIAPAELIAADLPLLQASFRAVQKDKQAVQAWQGWAARAAAEAPGVLTEFLDWLNAAAAEPPPALPAD